jgi:inosose dehydratase
VRLAVGNAGTGWGILHKAEAWADTEKLFRAIGQTHAAVGAEYVVHLPPMFRDEKTGDYIDDRTLKTEAWNLYIKNADRLGRIMKEDYGLKMVLHPHGDSHIETPEDIDRIFQATDPDYVGFCLDTGHIVYGNGDPMELCRKYPDRISYVHIKAMDQALVQQAHDEDWPFVKAVHAGCSVAPPAGLPDMGQLIEALADLDKELYVVCEQDMYGCAKDYPFPNAVKTREYLASLGLGSVGADLFNCAGHVFQQIRQNFRIADVVCAGHGAENFQRRFVHAQMQFEPSSMVAPAVLTDFPLAFAVDFDAG